MSKAISSNKKTGGNMREENYDPSSVESIVEYARKLTGKSLGEVTFIPADIANDRNRGDLGSLVESFYFEHRPVSNKGPDFAEAGLELKTTGVVKNSKGELRAKERLVLGMINFSDIIHEDWDNSSLLKKCQLMLILFYLYEKDRPVVDRRFVLDPLLFVASERDMSVIRNDWELIRKKVREGKAHELSEGDTTYLGACRKGSGGPHEPLRIQPFSDEGAKSRAFSFKQGFMNHLISGGDASNETLQIGEDVSFEEAVAQRFSPYVGITVLKIANNFGLEKMTANQKGFHRQLATKMLSDGGHSVPELNKAGIEMKTIRLNSTGKPRESMSFPGFKFMEILHEDWEQSSFFEKLEQKFLFIVFQPDASGIERFSQAVLWNMPYEDRLEAQRVWEDTKSRVAIDATNLPKASESRVAHVRPKGKNGSDKIATPQGGMHLKQAFWLNSSYIASVVNNHRQN
jgi:DNA mismatch repair protein MutH